jgi:hypothetical protein
MLPASSSRNAAVGSRRVNPRVAGSTSAHATSRRPATISAVQAMEPPAHPSLHGRYGCPRRRAAAAAPETSTGFEHTPASTCSAQRPPARHVDRRVMRGVHTWDLSSHEHQEPVIRGHGHGCARATDRRPADAMTITRTLDTTVWRCSLSRLPKRFAFSTPLHRPPHMALRYRTGRSTTTARSADPPDRRSCA